MQYIAEQKTTAPQQKSSQSIIYIFVSLSICCSKISSKDTIFWGGKH